MEQVTTYVAGAGVLLGDGPCWLLLDHVPDAGLLGRWYAVARGSDGPGTLEREVGRYAAGRGASFVLVDLTPGRERTVAGGRGALSVDGVLDVGLPSTGPSLPIGSGVVGAGSATVARAEAPGSAAGIIDGVPAEILAGRAEVPARRPASPAAGSTVARVGGHTMRRSDLGDHLRQTTHETVLAVRCLQGHPTPPQAPSCRVCGAPVPPQEPHRVPRPVLGRLVLPTGECVPLDRGVVFGRKPEPLPDGERWPHLVHLPADSTYLSRTHLQVELDGWLVIARDLGSGSGTTLRVPGRRPERIRAHDAHVLEPGNRLDLADVYEIVFEVTP